MEESRGYLFFFLLLLPKDHKCCDGVEREKVIFFQDEVKAQRGKRKRKMKKAVNNASR